MKIISKVKTFDGALHDSKKDATRHLDRLYANALLAVAGPIIAFTRRTELMEYLDAHLSAFAALQQIKDDYTEEED